MSTLGERLKLLRKEKKLTQEELASILNITRSALSLYELNKTEPPNPIKKLISDFFGVSIDYLCGYSDYPNTINYYSDDGTLYSKCPFIEFSSTMSEEIKYYIPVLKNSLNINSCFFTTSPDNFTTSRILKGDILFIHRNTYINDDSIMLINVKQKLLLTKIYKLQNEYLLFNPSNSYMIINAIDDDIEIIGKVIGTYFKLD